MMMFATIAAVGITFASVTMLLAAAGMFVRDLFAKPASTARQRLAFAPESSTAAQVLAAVGAQAEIRDLTVEEPAIEDIVATLYRAAGVAHLLETLDITELVPSDQPSASLRYTTWAAMLELAQPHRAPDEELRDTVRRLLSENVAARAIYLLILQEPGPKQ